MTNHRGIAVSRESLDRLNWIAQRAGQAAMRFYGNCAAESKSDRSPVTAADRAAHEAIVQELREWDPAIPIVSEEGEIPPYEARREWSRMWLVDPLDGTKEFIAGNGEFTVNIALIEAGEPVLGVVLAPALQLVYLGGQGLGSWRLVNGAEAEKLVPTSSSGDAIRVVESRSHPSARLEAFIAGLGRVERIRLGSSLKFCRVAEGGADLYPRLGPTMEWDVAAGDCVFRNSGGDGRPRWSPIRYNQPTLTIPEFVIGEALAGVSLAMGA